MSTGITAWQSEDVITFTFDPCILGTFYGPYKVRMKAAKDKQTNKGRIYLRGHDLPPAVPVTDLFNHFDKSRTGRARLTSSASCPSSTPTPLATSSSTASWIS